MQRPLAAAPPSRGAVGRYPLRAGGPLPSRSPHPRSWRQLGFGWHCWESYAVGRRWLALGCCISGQLTVGCRDGCAARAGGQAFHTWWATLRRHRSGQRRWTRCWTLLRTAPPAVGNFSYLWAMGPGGKLSFSETVSAVMAFWPTGQVLGPGETPGPEGLPVGRPERRDIRTMASLIGGMSSTEEEVERSRSAQGLPVL